MLRDSFTTAEVDMQARSLREAQVEAQRLVLATRSALSADGELLPEAEVAQLQAQLNELERTAQGSDHHQINAAVEALAHSTEAFAAARMNRSIHDALTGRRVDDI
jgi:molecular chaperone HscA